MKKILRTIQNRWRFSRLKATTKTRNELRHQTFYVEGKLMGAMRYIELLANKLPKMYRNGQPVEHEDLIKKYYYRFDLPGIKYYLQMIHQVEVNTNAKPVAKTGSN